MKNNQIIVLILVAILFAGVGFYTGTTYQKNQRPSIYLQGRNGQNNMMRRNGGQIVGEILSQDDKSITVKMVDGSSKIILLSTNTTVINSVEAKTTDLKVGSRVAVFGTTNTDGSVTAQNIQLNPISRIPTPTK